jgi:hypothetical protein
MAYVQSEPYWVRVKRERERLAAMFPDPHTGIYITIQGGPGNGRVVQALREPVARALADETHRLSTKEEIAKFEAEQSAAAEEIHKNSLERLPQYRMILPPEFEQRSNRRPKPDGAQGG